jgi:NagD protein
VRARDPFLVLTNNSIYTRRDLAARLRASGLHVPEEAIWTSALATARLLETQRPGGSGRCPRPDRWPRS